MKYQAVANTIKELKVACLVDKSNYQGSVIDPIYLLDILSDMILLQLNDDESIEFKKICKV